jgi:hypothetical protein
MSATVWFSGVSMPISRPSSTMAPDSQPTSSGLPRSVVVHRGRHIGCDAIREREALLRVVLRQRHAVRPADRDHFAHDVEQERS